MPDGSRLSNGVDQMARDQVARVQAQIERHEAVCEKVAENNRQTLERIEKAVAQIGRSYEVGITDLKENSREARSRIADEVVQLRKDVAEDLARVEKVLEAFIKKQGDTNKMLFDRFWAIGIAWGSTMTALAGLFASKYFHLL